MAALFGFWGIGAFFDTDDATAWLVLLAIPLVLAVFVVYGRVLARASGIPVAVQLGFRRGARGERFRAARLYLLMVTPLWWRPVLKATGWPVPLVVLALAAALAAVLELGPATGS